MNHDYDVVIAGGGPVGLCLAHELGLRGVRSLVLEKGGESGEPRSMGLHARTLAMLDRRGLLDAMTKAHERAGLQRFGGGFAGIFVLRGGGPPVGLGMSRDLIREVYRSHLKADVEHHAAVTGVDDRGDHVVVAVRGPGGDRQVAARYLVGCDGASSTVRREAGIPFSGTGPTVTARLAEVAAPVAPGWRRTSNGWVVGLPFDRVMTLEWEAEPDSPVTAEEVRHSVERLGGQQISLRDNGFVARFTDAALQAESYRSGRVFLAGDAAHIHLPVGGQGVNLGLQDAMNLGWKLAAACAGTAPDGLLDTYHAERHPVGAAVVANTRAQSALMRPGPQVDALRELFTELLTRFTDVNALITGRIDGTAVRYPKAPDEHDEVGSFAADRKLVTPAGPVRLAELLRSATGVLLDGSGRLSEVAAPWAGQVRHVPVEPDGAAPESVLVRPDGHVAWAADLADAESLRAALRTWFGAGRSTC